MAVFVGTAFAAPGQRSLENTECDPGPTMAKNLLVCEVVSFSCFLLSSLVAKSLRLDLKVNREKNFKDEVLQILRRILLYVSGLATVVGCTLLMASMICLVQIRLGKIDCKSLHTETATYCMVGIVAVALLIYIAVGGWAMHRTFASRGGVDLDEGKRAVDSSAEGNEGACVGPDVSEPYVGMEFDSEDAARNFYFEYARRVGFVVRLMQRCRSEIDGRTIARRLGCNKQGFSPNHGTIGPDKKPLPCAREGCRATILVKLEKSGKWVVSRFEKEHNHPMVVTGQRFSYAGDKDEKIEQLTLELQRQDQLCAAYREKLLRFLANVEEQAEHLASKIEVIVDNVRKVEAEVHQLSQRR